MHTHSILPLLGWLALACLSAPRALAMEVGQDPWVGEGGGRYVRTMDMEDEEGEDSQGRGGEPQKPLYRCSMMNGLESAQYSVAELLLLRGDVKAAIPAVESVLAKTENEQVRDITHFNLAKLYRRIGNLAEATKHYQEVKGLLRYAATRRLLDMLTQAGRLDEAEKVTDDLLAKAKQKGEKLADLHRLAQTLQRRRMPDRALAVYQRIAKEFTPDDMKQMVRDVEKEVETAFDRTRKQVPNNPGALNELLQHLRETRLEELQAAGRWDESAALDKAIERANKRIQQQQEEEEPKPEKKEAAKEEAPPPKKEMEF